MKKNTETQGGILSAADLVSRVKAAVNEEVQHLKDQLAERDATLESYRKDHGSLEALKRDLIEAVRPCPPVKVVAPRPGKGTATVAAVMRVSDGHHGAVQNPDEIERLGSFSPDISTSRQIGYAQSVVKWVSSQRNAYNINDLHIIVTGDMISGDIHEELRVTNAFPAPVQAIRAGELLAQQIMTVAPHFRTVVVDFIADDNHGRLTKKPQAKEAGLNTFNFIVGSYAEALVKKQSNVDFRLHPVHETVVDVNGRRYLACHGHGVMGWAGVPWYGIERKVGKEAQTRMQVIMEDVGRAREIGFHKYLFGHFHTDICTELYDGCASVSGTDAFDHKCGRYGRPGQCCWLVHPKHGEFNRINWDLRIFDGGVSG